MRLQEWDKLLAAIIKERRTSPFVWGQHDCCLFAADCALAMTGTDFAAEFRGQYDTAKGAARLIAERGGFEAMITGLLGKPVPVTLARRGDVVMLDQDGHPALAVCYGVDAVAAGITGLAFRPMAEALAAWRVD